MGNYTVERHDMAPEGVWFRREVQDAVFEVYGSRVGIYGNDERVVCPEEDAIWWLHAYANSYEGRILATLSDDAQNDYLETQPSDLIAVRTTPANTVGPVESAGQPVRLVEISSRAYR